MFGITDNPEGKTAFEQLDGKKKKKILLGEDLPKSAPEQTSSDLTGTTEDPAPAKIDSEEKDAAAEKHAPASAELISEKALETKPKEVPKAVSVPVEIGEEKKTEPVKAPAVPDNIPEEIKPEPKKKAKPEPKPAPEKPVEKKTNSLPPKPAENSADDFFNKPLNDEDKAAFKKTFGGKSKSSKVKEEPAVPEKTEAPEKQDIPEEEKTAFQKTANQKIERFWDDGPKEPKPKSEPTPEVKEEIKPEIKPEPKPEPPKPVEKKTNSLPPKPAGNSADDFFNKPLNDEDKAAFKKAFWKNSRAVEEPAKPVFPEKPAEVKPEPKLEPKPEPPKPVEKKTNSLPPKPVDNSADAFFDKPVDQDELAAFKKAFGKKPTAAEEPAKPAFPEKPVEVKPEPKPEFHKPAENVNPFPAKPANDSADDIFSKPVDKGQLTAFQKFGQKPVNEPAPKPAKKINPFDANLSEAEQKEAFEKAFGKKIKTSAEKAAEKRAAISQNKVSNNKPSDEDYIPFKLADMYSPANDRTNSVKVPTTSKDFKLEGIGEMYRPEKEFNRDEFWENAKKGLNSEESREMYWQLKREQRDKKLKKGLKIALSLSIMGLLTAVAMLVARLDCFSYIQIGITVLISFLLLMIAPFVKTLGILGSLFNIGWSGYFAFQFYMDNGFALDDTALLIKYACFAVVIVFSLIIFIRLCSSKLLSEYYDSNDKKDRESIIKSNPMNR